MSAERENNESSYRSSKEEAVQGVTVRLTLALAVAGLVTAAAAGAAVQPLGKLILRPAQVGPGYRLVQRPDGHGAQGFVTLDMCGYQFLSEALRTGRLQVNYVKSGAAIKFSNEVVTYVKGGAQFALREVSKAVATCPRGPVTGNVKGEPPTTYRITTLHPSGLLAGAIVLRARISATVNGKQVSEEDSVIYQVRGNVLSAVYTYGGTRAARETAALHAARQAAKNLIG
jgi:opacity protein-like surface antigen